MGNREKKSAKNINKIRAGFLRWMVLMFILVAASSLYGQVEMVAPSNTVYDFLRRMQYDEIIEGYNPANIPLSRGEVADFLKTIDEKSQKLSKVDRELLGDFKIEFSYDINDNLNSTSSLFSIFKWSDLVNNDKQKYLYAYADSNVSMFLDVTGNLYQRNANGDTYGSRSITLGEAGFRLRGTLFKSVGYYLRASNGVKLSGDKEDVKFAAETDPKLKANTKFVYENKNFDSFEGYLRYETPKRWLGLTVGREALFNGTGYIDKMFLSNNTVPFDFLKLDLKYKALSYSFLYGSLKGDSMGVDLSSKNIAYHRLDIRFAKWMKLGFTETVIMNSKDFSFTYLNPISFLVSADLNTGVDETYKNNALLGIDLEVNPVRNVAIQGTLLVDDFNAETVFNNDSTSTDNKYGYQAGVFWNEAFTLPGLTAALEYTRLNPFVYSHRSNKNQYTNWGMPLGHNLSPNSDEIAAMFSYYVYKRLRVDLKYQYQRSGTGFEYDSTGAMIKNYGGDINVGYGDAYNSTKFLDGKRVNRHIFTLNAVFQPIRQYFVEFWWQYRFQDLVYAGKTSNDNIFFVTVRIDY